MGDAIDMSCRDGVFRGGLENIGKYIGNKIFILFIIVVITII